MDYNLHVFLEHPTAWPGIRLVRKSESGQVGRKLDVYVAGVLGLLDLASGSYVGVKSVAMSLVDRSPGDVCGRISLMSTTKAL